MDDFLIVEGSTSVRGAAYNAAVEILTVDFTSGTYEYLGVPEHVWQAFKDAPSKGRFLNSDVKPIYPFNKVS